MIDYLRSVEDFGQLSSDAIAVAVVVSEPVYSEHDPETGEQEMLVPGETMPGLFVLIARPEIDEALWSDEAVIAEIDRPSGAMLRCRDAELVGCTITPQWAGSAGIPLAMAVPDVAGRKARMAEEIDAIWLTKHTAGYPHDFGAPYGVKVLQTRESDQPFWLALAQVSSIMVAQSMGDLPNGSIRTLDNANVPVTASEALAAMLGMQAYLGTILAYSWALKDQVANAADLEALDAIDITAGWPA